MTHLLKTKIGKLRIVGFLEGASLLLLVFIGVPLKYGFGYPAFVKALGPVHGALFLLFIINTISAGVEQNWRFRETTWNVLLACMVPFGTFYVDRHILRKL